MIVDCHTHIWSSNEQLGRGLGLFSTRSRGRGIGAPLKASEKEHWAAAGPVDKSLVMGFKSHYLQADVPNDYVADYARQHPEKLIAVASVDPTRPREAIEELRRARKALGMKGAMVWPAIQDFHPASTAAMRVYAEISELKMPLIFHQDVQACPTSKMDYARPCLIDEVAREFPDMKIIVSQLGYPWTEETIVLLAKHGNVYADISGMTNHPWHAYNALLAAHQAGVMEGLLFGSNFPYSSAARCIESLYSINQFCHGTNLPTIPREQLRQIVERNALAALGIESQSSDSPQPMDTTVIKSDD